MKLKIASIAIFSLVALMNCSSGYQTGGFAVFQNYTLNKDVSTGTDLGTKVGKACASNILGWMTTGEGGIKEASAKVDMKKIKAVDYQITGFLGFWTRVCTIARGD
ncbi:TRL-like family protein [Leptospira mtsangambouensis]|uniref:TRL-like family protein n=1 Tax=Leptospira mtsangambouensis TaxID=2484912 RepID=UPI001EEC6A15|nr:TRL-like family protein [Leptospira mtsangambouensis]MCG6139402.1 TRL-like family protein [Leptospira mtsangambouensis]